LVRLTVVTGPPAGGKTTHIREHAAAGDVVIDLDRIASVLTTEGGPDHGHVTAVTRVARAARDAAIREALSLTDDTAVWLIDSNPTPAALARYTERGARVVTCDPGPDVLAQRLADRGPDAARAARQYQARTTRPRPPFSPLDW
jgi:hypothetical protein